MPYRILTAIGEDYHSETVTPVGERESFLNQTAENIKWAIKQMDDFKASGGGPKVATNLPEGPGRVKALAKFHEQQQANVGFMDRCVEILKKQRLMAVRQGAKLKADGTVIWPAVPVTVQYDRDLAQQSLTRLDIRGGVLYTADGKPFDTRFMVTAHSGPGYAIYVMSAEGNFHVSSHAVGLHHHSSLLAGGEVAGAGEMMVTAGTLVYLSNKSGHYQPDMYQFFQTLHALEKAQVPMTFQLVMMPGKTLYPSVDAFMKDHGWDNDAVEAYLLCQHHGQDKVNAVMQSTPYRFMPADALSAGSRAGFYDFSASPPTRASLDQMEQVFSALLGKTMDDYIVKSGEGR